jgi:hypothetical protein
MVMVVIAEERPELGPHLYVVSLVKPKRFCALDLVGGELECR